LGEDIRAVAWLGDSRKQVRSFPPEVRKSIGVALYDAQKGDKAPTAKPFKGVDSGVFEIALRFDKDAYRCVYTKLAAATCLPTLSLTMPTSF
jgi:phage-related protein